jgi:hypothetical protein
VYEEGALEAAVKLSHTYIADRFLPDKVRLRWLAWCAWCAWCALCVAGAGWVEGRGVMCRGRGLTQGCGMRACVCVCVCVFLKRAPLNAHARALRTPQCARRPST